MDPLNLNSCPNQKLPTLSFDGDPSVVIKEYLTAVNNCLEELQLNRTPAAEVVLWRTAAIDQLLQNLFKRADLELRSDHQKGGHYVVAAQGGYGRQDLCIHSDIDLLFLHDHLSPKLLKPRIEKILYPLWDNGLDIGFAVRTEKECLQMMKDDLTILTALMEARYLAGENKLFKKFQRSFWKTFENRRFRDEFIKRKEEEQEERARKFGGSVYLLEPNTKESKGGLRDYHHIRWVTQVAFGSADIKNLVKADWIGEAEYEQLGEAVAFLWAIRNELHRRSGRKTDQILFEYQAPLAAWFGFQDSEKILAVEDFMRTYYRHAAECFRISTKVNRKLQLANRTKGPFSRMRPGRKKVGQHFEIRNQYLSLKTADLFAKQPHYLMKVFQIIQERGVELGRSVKEAIRANLHRVDDAFIRNPENTQLFRGMLAHPQTVVQPLMAMHEVGVLERFMPEFRNLMYRVQHDIYHLYTVDIHSILAVGELGKLLRGEYEQEFPTPTAVARTIEKMDLLAFAVLYHDIGKGLGSGHVAKGAPLIRQAAERLGFTSDEVDKLEFLELSHLLMTHLAFRRDLDDPNMILQFAESMGHEEQLKLLYVQTFCDVKGTNPEALTNWKESLLEYLFLKTRSVLIKGDYSKERVREIAQKLKHDVTLLAGDDIPAKELDNYFNIMPPRYFLTAEPVTTLDHIALWRRLEQQKIVSSHRSLEKEGLSEWTLFTLDEPALFPKVCGVLAANGINIQEALLNTTSEGQALHIFKVLSAQGTQITRQDKWEKLEADIQNVLQGKVTLQQLLGSRLGPSLLKPKTARKLPSKVKIDNDVSAFYTVIDIYTHDRVGLLYQITSALVALGLYVDISKIATKVDQVTDTFYVRDIFGHKVTSGERLERIRKTLIEVLESGEATEMNKVAAQAKG